MTDEHVVVVTTDENLFNQLRNATTMEVVHLSNHDSAKEKSYRRKLVILDPDTVPTSQQELSTWHENAHYLIVLLENHDDTFIEQNQEIISDVWLKPVNFVLLEKRFSVLRRYVKVKNRLPYYMEFAGMEFNTPLNSIRGYTEILLGGHMGLLNDEQQEALQAVRTSAIHFQDLMNDMRDWTKIEFGEFQLDIKNQQLPGILTDIAALKELSAVKNPAQLYPFELEIQDELPDLYVDESKLIRVITNVLYAAKNNNSSNTKMKVWYEEDFIHIAIASEKEFIWLESDGFRILSKILGTEIVTYIIEQHGGEIFIETNPETGSTFHFTIPIAQENTPDD